MITIDYALRIYTNQVNANEAIDMAFYKQQLSVVDFNEFEELIPFIGLLKSSKITQGFKDIFARVDAHKKTIYNLQSVANFRADKNTVTENTLEKINAIFGEEFDDE